MSLTKNEIAEYATRFRKKSEEPMSKTTIKQYQRNLEILAELDVLKDVFSPNVFFDKLKQHATNPASLTLYIKSVMKLFCVMNAEELGKAWADQQDFSFCHINSVLSQYKRFMANHIQDYKQRKANTKGS